MNEKRLGMHHDRVTVPGQKLSPGQVPSALERSRSSETVFIGVVEQVHTDRGTMDVALHDAGNVERDIPLVFPYMGTVGMIGTCPEIGSMVVIMKSARGYIPLGYKVGSPQFAPAYTMLEKVPEEDTDPVTELNRVTPWMYRPIRPGETRIASKYNAEVFLDKNVDIHDSMDNSFRIRSGDGSAIASSQQNYMFTTGVWRSAGPIQRNSLKAKIAGEDRPGYEATEVMTSDGQRVVYIGGEHTYGGTSYNEYRIEIEDSSLNTKPVNDVNFGKNVIHRTPKVIFAMGNYVGNDEKNIETYGKFMAPNFVSDSRGDGALNFVALTPNGDRDTLGRQGIAWAYHVPDRGFFGMDKEGVNHVYLGQASGDNPGLSQVVVGRGGKREEWGITREGGISWDFFARGGVQWTIGKSLYDASRGILPRSSVVRYIGATYTEHGYSENYDPKILRDYQGNLIPYYKQLEYKKVTRVAGNGRLEVDGIQEDFIGLGKRLQVGAEYKVSVSGAYSESTMGDRTISTASVLSLNAVNGIQTTAKQRTEKFVEGGDEKTIVLGDEKLEILAGNQEVNLLLGDSKRTLGVGSCIDVIGVGDSTTSIATGNFSVETQLGDISLKSTVGTAVLGGTSVDIDATIAANINAPTVGIGGAVRSGVITFLSHRDYVTGAPLVPSITVTASS